MAPEPYPQGDAGLLGGEVAGVEYRRPARRVALHVAATAGKDHRHAASHEPFDHGMVQARYMGGPGALQDQPRHVIGDPRPGQGPAFNSSTTGPSWAPGSGKCPGGRNEPRLSKGSGLEASTFRTERAGWSLPCQATCTPAPAKDRSWATCRAKPRFGRPVARRVVGKAHRPGEDDGGSLPQLGAQHESVSQALSSIVSVPWATTTNPLPSPIAARGPGSDTGHILDGEVPRWDGPRSATSLTAPPSPPSSSLAESIRPCWLCQAMVPPVAISVVRIPPTLEAAGHNRNLVPGRTRRGTAEPRH